MKKLIVTSILAIGLATPALAAEKYFVTIDTVGNCSIVQSVSWQGSDRQDRRLRFYGGCQELPGRNPGR
jgi:hypothetical protein